MPIISESKVIYDDKEWRRIMKETKNFEPAYSAIGTFEDSVYSNGLYIAQVWFWNEYGTGRIPERPAMRDWFDGHLAELKKMAEELWNDVLLGRKSAIEALEEFGEYAKEGIKRSVIDFNNPPNAPATIAAKGFDDPLIWTGQLRDSIKHEEFIGKEPPKE